MYRPEISSIFGRTSATLKRKRHGSPKHWARGHLSLWRDSNLRPKNVAHLNELQLFDLPPIRGALGVLQHELS